LAIKCFYNLQHLDEPDKDVHMKKIPTLLTSFAIAASALFLGEKAKAQTTSVAMSATQSHNRQAATVSQKASDEIANTSGVQTVFRRSGIGFSEGISSTAENVGLEFSLGDGSATVMNVFNLDNASEARAYERRKAQVKDAERVLIQKEHVPYSYQSSSIYSQQGDFANQPREREKVKALDVIVPLAVLALSVTQGLNDGYGRHGHWRPLRNIFNSPRYPGRGNNFPFPPFRPLPPFRY
jgi:hypothetical protein